MKTSHKIALGTIAGLSITIGTVALAHDHEGMMKHGPGGMMGSGMMGSGMMMGPGMRGQFQNGGPEARLETLKSELNLSSAQEPAWTAFESTVQAQMAGHQAGHDMAEGSDPMQSRIARMEQMLGGMKEVQKARNDLYQVLTPEQQKVLDEHGPHSRHNGPHGRHG